MADLDISFEEAKLQALKDDIDRELVAVRTLLMQVAAECESDPAEDDTVLIAIQKIGNEMHEAWGNLCDAFDKVSKKITDIFTGYNETATTQSNNADSMDRHL